MSTRALLHAGVFLLLGFAAILAHHPRFEFVGPMTGTFKPGPGVTSISVTPLPGRLIIEENY